jgi:probable blue pigment (indigoidine) exporter
MQGPAVCRWTRVAAFGAGGLLVLILGSTLVIAKGALAHIGPLTLAALRYGVATVVLLPLALWRAGWRSAWRRHVRLRLVAIGVGFYALGNGALFLGLHYVPAATAALALGLVPLVTLLGGLIWLGERATGGQVLGLALALAGTGLFFASGLGPGEPMGLAILALGLLGNASLGLLGRPLAQAGQVSALMLTAAPLTIGGVILLPVALVVDGTPRLLLADWATILWLGLVNTALAYLLYNRLLRSQAAFEVSALTSLSPLVTAIGAWLVLAEPLLLVQLLGMGLAVGGVAVVQLGRPTRHPPMVRLPNDRAS